VSAAGPPQGAGPPGGERRDAPVGGDHTSLALETRALCKSFGALTVADRIDFRLEAGARHALIGPNGSGKTTFVNMLTGRIAPTSGRILVGDEDVTSLAQAARVKRGLGRTFQINMLFQKIPVLDNVALAVAERMGVARRMLRAAARERVVLDESLALLDTLGLADDANLEVAGLPYGKQRLVEIAIALGLAPRVLLLDEPAAGVPSLESHRILDVLGKLPTDIAILIIEHDMDLVFRFARRITVLAEGSVLTEGTPAEIAADRRVRSVYLGERHA
jgi:branched-chain amino acid transport system ATP-binding protein